MTTTNPKHKNTKGGKYAAPNPKSSTVTTTAITSVTTSGSEAINNISSRRRPKKKKWYQKLNLSSFYALISKKDVMWYWDVKKWIPAILVVVLLVYFIGYNKGEADQAAYFETMPAETIYIEVPAETQPTEVTEPVLDEEAVALAILADTSASGRSDSVKRILMWVAINRVEDRSNGYGGSLIEEINRPKQWQGYNADGMYLQSTYDIAIDILNTWRSNGPRPIYNDMLWSVYNPDGSITVRNRFNDTKGRNEQTFE